MNKIHYTAKVNKHIQRLLNDTKYYKKHFKKHGTIEILSEDATIDDETYNTLVIFCFGNLDGNGWLDITYWLKDQSGTFLEVACGEPTFRDNSTDTYEDDAIQISVTTKFEE